MNPWSILQLAWIWGKNASIYETGVVNSDRRVFPMEFQYGTAAYVVSRYGMEAIVDAYFSSRAPTGKVRLLPKVEVAESYFERLPNVLVALPSLFTVRGLDTFLLGGQAGRERNEQHRDSNRRHIDATMELYYHAMQKHRPT